MRNQAENHLFYGDNLDILRTHVDDASVDLVYLDPPFNSNASYNILFKAPAGSGADAAIEAFDDTWQWGPAANAAMLDITVSGNHALHALMHALHDAIGENAMMAYLAMMAVRLVELHAKLKPTGCLYLHCDPTASHYLKLVLDAVFGPQCFLNEITWKRTTAHSDGARYGRNTDIILFYAKSPTYTWNPQFTAYDEDYAARFRQQDADGRRWMDDNLTAKGLSGGGYTYAYKGVTSLWRMPVETMERLDAEGRLHFTSKGGIRLKRYLDEAKGMPLQALWTDIPPINSQAQERLGYPTQKPRALLERIVATSSNAGDIVLDPFCGCGTAVDAAQRLGRHWIGIDITHLAIGLIEKRLREGYGEEARFDIVGVPKDLASAQRLASDDPYQFQQWITLKLGGWPWAGGKKGGDKGVDGYFYYIGDRGRSETGVISVKAGAHINPGMVRDLGRVMARDGHRLGLFVCAALPTRGMEAEARSHGLIETEFGRFPALQIFTLAELFQDRRPKLPPLVSPNRRAPRIETRASHQAGAQGDLL